MTTVPCPAGLEELGPEHFAFPRAPRVYEVLLGGTETYQCDRDAALDLYMVAPWVMLAARTNRWFTEVATEAALRLGARQFLDLGCGLSNQPDLHHLVPDGCPVVYADRDPGVLAHAKSWLDPGPPHRTTVVAADLLDMRGLLARPELHGALDLARPIAVTVHDVLPWNTDDAAVADAMTVLRDWLPVGSTLSITHLTPDLNPAQVPEVASVYEQHGIPVRPRSRTEIDAFFGGFTRLGTGLTAVSQWSAHGPNVRHFTPYPARASDAPAYAGIAVKTDRARR
ncbi:SAM-dependent methyltransferase [Streptomyces clavuligerus]|uniref:DUF574 domain-containing protein n=1 Tax=Streptomyces clavuligerus TaxID=1901 RepID=B5GPG5_STRCL|nr:SAM-dependent methyltransferase [Streptomyces clavuligerus]ANW21966.1 hypothetical protein BB341_16150 [Streptomyces clavuligerus]AXU16596.1 hypothetical protein D1794_16850 [Streptomyces clavuligerus]EDY48211.1 conserved hypothetical protein [Streptomyces clavuligerus]EFG07534.1 DUF574 domain-containing protein [Streptomyces clavuligerus]MBY6304253.1 SAM-dependent methyltransferase [Streptomyces clavuligerus]